MVSTGTDHRKTPRQQFHYRASILLKDDPAPRTCSLADISATGAKVTLDTFEQLPEQFVLLLTPSGSARRLCRVVWQTELVAGVRFANAED